MDEASDPAGGTVGELLRTLPEAVLVWRRGRVANWNPAAEVLLGPLPAGGGPARDRALRRAFGSAVEEIGALAAAGSGRARLECRGGTGGSVDAVAWRFGGDEGPDTLIMLHDATAERRQAEGLRRLGGAVRGLMAEPSLAAVLAGTVDAAKELVGADLAVLVLLRAGTADEVAHFVHTGPRSAGADEVRRVEGVLALPARTGTVVRLDDAGAHPSTALLPAGLRPVAAVLAAPLRVGPEVAGTLAVANGPARPGFGDADEIVVAELAAHAGVVLARAGAGPAPEELDEARRALVDAALHHVRTPLTVAKGFLATLRRHGGQLSPADRDRAFEAIARAHDRIQRLAEGALLDEARTTGAGDGRS